MSLRSILLRIVHTIAPENPVQAEPKLTPEQEEYKRWLTIVRQIERDKRRNRGAKWEVKPF